MILPNIEMYEKPKPHPHVAMDFRQIVYVKIQNSKPNQIIESFWRNSGDVSRDSSPLHVVLSIDWEMRLSLKSRYCRICIPVKAPDSMSEI